MRKFRREQDGKQVQRVLVNMILDKSGSMENRANDVIGGFNSYLEELKKDDQTDYRISVVLFDTLVNVISEKEPLATIKPLTTKEYRPGGGTALLDAVGNGVSRAKTDDVTKIITVIMTDGEENSSKTWTYDKVKELIDEKEKEGNWTFIFMGETLEVAKEGQRVMAAYAANTYTYNKSVPSASYNVLSANMVRFARSSALMSTDLGIDDENMKAIGSTTNSSPDSSAMKNFVDKKMGGSKRVRTVK